MARYDEHMLASIVRIVVNHEDLYTPLSGPERGYVVECFEDTGVPLVYFIRGHSVCFAHSVNKF